MNYCKFIILSVFLIFAPLSSQAQGSTSGIVIYHQKINLSYLVNQHDTLRFNRTTSIFQWNTANFPSNTGKQEIEKNFPDAQEGEKSITMQPEIYYGTQVNVLDTEKDNLFSLMGMRYINKLLYLKEKTPQINWSIKDSTKNIGNYNVQKATATFRGRDYTAWFTPEIPVPYGPWKLHGLPGLILQAYDRSGSIYFSAINITLNNNKSISSLPLNDMVEKVTFAEYKDILKNYELYQKRSLLKQIRPLVSKEDFANMNVHLQPIKHMERFGEDEQ